MLKLKLIFTILLCISLTSIASETCKKKNPDEVKNLPHYKYYGDIFSGYLNINKSGTRKLHYVFLPSQSNPETDPVVFWFNGGPGCSSMTAFIQGHGPVIIPDYTTDMVENPFSWNKEANMVYIESPIGTGFSYSDDLKDSQYASSDNSSAIENRRALISWYTKYDSYRTNPMYLSGESYAGVYVPLLASEILDFNDKQPTHTSKLNLKGILIGNPVTDWNIDVEMALVDFAYTHFLFSKETKEQFDLNCTSKNIQNFLINNPDPISEICLDAKRKIKESLEGINIYDIYRKCPHNQNQNQAKASSLKYLSPMEVTVNLFKKIKNIKRSNDNHNLRYLAEDISLWPSHCKPDEFVINYLNDEEVKKALNVKTDLTWENCSQVVQDNYSPDLRASFYIYPKLIAAKLKIEIFSGDADACVPVNGTLKVIENLNLKVKSEYKAWKLNGEVVGFEQQYEGLTFRTVKGVGHMVVQWKREEAFQLFKDFLFNLNN